MNIQIHITTTEGDRLVGAPQELTPADVVKVQELVCSVVGASPEQGSYLHLDLEDGTSVFVPGRFIYLARMVYP